MKKPTAESLGIDLGALTWQRSGTGEEAIEVAFAEALGAPWVLMRVANDPDKRVLVYNQQEWEAFLDGAKKGEFDDATV